MSGPFQYKGSLFMGGNALSFETKRLFVEQYDKLYIEVTKNLEKSKITKHALRTRHYYNKPSFGDMDLVCLGSPPKDIKEKLNTIFGNKDFHRNSNVISFDYKDFQIDLLFYPKEDFTTAYFYFSFNDLNNFIGKIAHKFGLKFGHTGLIAPIRSEDNKVVETITISKEPKEIYDFLGYDYFKWILGFDTLEEIFKFVVSSPYFSVDMFDDKNLNNRARTRDRKRANYKAFLKWLKDNQIKTLYNFSLDKNEYIEFIDKSFPLSGYKSKVEKARLQLQIKKKISEKFNGRIIMGILPNLSGKNLGNLIRDFKAAKGNNENFQSWVLNNEQEEISKQIKQFYYERN